MKKSPHKYRNLFNFPVMLTMFHINDISYKSWNWSTAECKKWCISAIKGHILFKTASHLKSSAIKKISVDSYFACVIAVQSFGCKNSFAIASKMNFTPMSVQNWQTKQRCKPDSSLLYRYYNYSHKYKPVK